MSYLENPGNQIIHDALELYSKGPNGMSLTRERMPMYPPEFATASVNALIHALLEAEKAREKSRSYRGFRVGAAAVAYYYGPTSTRKLTVARGANAKPVEGSDIINVHAEHTVMTAIDAAALPGDSIYVPLLAVVGDLQPDQQSGEETLTLHPCGVCR